MTHDELLARIAKLSITPETNVVSSELATALMAVVELHAPCTGGQHDDSIELINEPCICIYCPDDIWPCPTIQAIEKELK